MAVSGAKRSFDRTGGEEDGRPRRSPDAALAPPPRPGPRQRRGPARRLRPPGREPAARSGSRTGRELSRRETAARRVRRRRRPGRVGAAAARGRASGGVRSATLAKRSGRSGPHHRFPKLEGTLAASGSAAGTGPSAACHWAPFWRKQPWRAQDHGIRTSSIWTGRCSRSDSVQASATHPVSTASWIVQGDARRPATTSVNAISSW